MSEDSGAQTAPKKSNPKNTAPETLIDHVQYLAREQKLETNRVTALNPDFAMNEREHAAKDAVWILGRADADVVQSRGDALGEVGSPACSLDYLPELLALSLKRFRSEFSY